MLNKIRRTILSIALSVCAVFLCAAVASIPKPMNSVTAEAASSLADDIIKTNGRIAIYQNYAALTDTDAGVTIDGVLKEYVKNQIYNIHLYISGTMSAPSFTVSASKVKDAGAIPYNGWNLADVGGKGKATLRIYQGSTLRGEYTTGKSNFDLTTYGYKWVNPQTGKEELYQPEHKFSVTSLEYNKNYKIEVEIDFSSLHGTSIGTYKRVLTYNVRFERDYLSVEGWRVFFNKKLSNTFENSAYYDEKTATYYVNSENLEVGWDNCLASSNKTTDKENPKIVCRPNLFVTVKKDGTTLEKDKAGLSLSADAAKVKNDFTFSDEGTYDFTFMDAKNNVYNTWKVVLDKTAPTFNVKDKDGGVVQDNGYFADDLAVTLSERVRYAEYIGDIAGGVGLSDGKFTVPKNVLSSNGAVTIETKDLAGNVGHITLNRFVDEDFGNIERVESSYKQTSWYNVRLPKNRYPSKTEWDFSFATYDEALAFAKNQEYEHRVQRTASGWTYSTANNYANTQEYNDAATLDLCVEKWAKTYVSERQVFSSGTNAYYVEPTALTKNAVPVPGEIAADFGYSNGYYINDAFVFNYDDYRKQRSITHTVTAQYIGDYVDGTLVNANGAGVVTIEKGTTWKAYAFNQGFYIITEKDGALNQKSYLVYYDKTAPTLSMIGTLGNGDERAIETKDEFNGSHFVSLTFGAASDNREVSDDLLIKIDGRGFEGVEFRSIDEIPTLSAENDYYGLYTISVYDRSKNVRAIEVYIAPSTLPSWSYSSLGNEVKLRLVFNANFRYNSIKELKIYNVLSNGDLKEIEKDGDGVDISFLTSEYVFYVGGKYQAKITDIYDRTVWTNAIFYKKGLPSGTLEGVQDGGITRQSVTFTCASEYGVNVYTIDEGARVIASNSLYTEKTEGEYKKLTFIAEDQTSHKYLISVYNPANEELFVEYAFEIDTICSDVIVRDIDGAEIGYDAATTKGFYIDLIEPGTTLTYYVNKDNGLNGNNYRYKTQIYADGTYYFTIKDSVGNTKKFTVLIDRVVQYEITGEHFVKNGQIVAKEPIKLTVMERFTTFNLSNGATTYENGSTLPEGLYSVYSEDVYGNAMSLSILIDMTAPTVTLNGVSNGGITRQNVTLAFEDGATAALTNSKGGVLETLTNGRVFDVDGDFYVVVTDYAGNETLATFSIRTKINFSSNVLNDQITSEAVQVEFPADVQLTIKRNGEQIDYQTRYTAVGEYEIYALDAIGNEVLLTFKIIDRMYRTYAFEIPQGWTVTQIYCNDVSIETETTTFNSTGVYILTLTDGTSLYELIIEIDATAPTAQIEVQPNGAKITPLVDKEAKATLTKDGVLVEDYVYGNNITESGLYVLTLTDEMGNETVYEFDVPFVLDTFAIVAIVAVSAILLAMIIFVAIKSRRIKI